MAKRPKTYDELDRLAVRLARGEYVDLEALIVPDYCYVIVAANRFDLIKCIAAELRLMGPDHLSALVKRWAEGGDPSKNNP